MLIAGAPLYTVADRRTPHHFAVAVDGRRRPAVVAFRSYQAAFFVARALEHRELALGEMLQRGAWHEVAELRPAPFSLREPKHVFPRAWDRLEELVTTCREQGRDVLYCPQLKPLMAHPIEFPGRVFATTL